jgi:hypothetical protein
MHKRIEQQQVPCYRHAIRLILYAHYGIIIKRRQQQQQQLLHHHLLFFSQTCYCSCSTARRLMQWAHRNSVFHFVDDNKTITLAYVTPHPYFIFLRIYDHCSLWTYLLLYFMIQRFDSIVQ